MVEALVFVAILILIPVLIYLWILWMKFCLKYWIKSWARKNSVTLVDHEMHWRERGPFQNTLLFMLPTYRITATTTEGDVRFGWVNLGIGFFYGGKGQVTWD